VTNNEAVVSAFQKVTGKKITVPPHFDVTGAIGAAILAQKQVADGRPTRFRGFDVSRVPYTLDRFTCRHCANQCQIRRVRIEGKKRPLFYGGRCERWEPPERKGKGLGIPNLFEERLRMLLGDYEDDRAENAPEATGLGEGAGNGKRRPTIGIPRALMVFYQQFPFWRTFFADLGFRVVLSEPSNRRLVTRSLEALVAETCFPVEVMHGHVLDLLEKGVDHVFLPFVLNAKAEPTNPTFNWNCPWVQTYPFMIRSAMREDPQRDRLLTPRLYFRFGARFLQKDLIAFMGDRFAIDPRRVRRAVIRAMAAQNDFEEAVAERGRQVLANLPVGKEAVVILGRPYNTGDPELNLHLADKLINLDVLPVPLDFLPLETANIFDDYPMMYWPNGERILAGARLIAGDERLHAVFMGNFRCGPDSFLLHYVTEEMHGKPFLQLEVDEHSADAGMITRCEAFLDSLRGSRQTRRRQREPVGILGPRANGKARTLYFPYMRDSAYLVSAAVRGCGMDSRVLPMQNDRDLELGRRHTSSRECFPMICTVGSFLRKIEEPGFDPRAASFFMPSHGGPCRFGQYCKLQRLIFDRLGYRDVEIVSPTNENSYSELGVEDTRKFRTLSWQGIVAADLLKKFLQERRPYEKNRGSVETTYRRYLRRAEASVEGGARDLPEVLREAAGEFGAIPLVAGQRKPVIAVVGEIFMRDNPFCSGGIIERLEDLGAETIVAPLREWIAFTTHRYRMVSGWKKDFPALLRAAITDKFQSVLARRLDNAVRDDVEMDRNIEINEMLELCQPYVDNHYSGDPPIALGTAAALARTGISGVVNVLPFTCLPGTLVAALSGSFRKDHDNIPWVDIAFDGQQDASIETRLQAFMHQAREFALGHGFARPRRWR
jgi:predicted nucleotide-binding protein (sugar kinase/HSP70/actin superfamily)